MLHTKPLIIAALATGLLSGPVWADHWHDDDKHWRKHATHHGDDEDEDDGDFDHHTAGCFFQPHDVWVINEYYSPHYRSLPPGLAMKYFRTGQLPPGWQKKLQPFPATVERQLVELPPEYRRGVIDGYAVVYNPRTQVVIDVMAVFGR
jgi:hypothetical protein